MALSEVFAEQRAVPAALAANQERRVHAETEAQAARDELAALLARGQAVGLKVAKMARAAGISRDTAHRLLREVGSVSWQERDRRAREERKSSEEGRS